MKKIIIYILIGLTTLGCIYNTYKITTSNNKTTNKIIKEKYDSSSIDKEINRLIEENIKLTEEINLLKEENIKIKNQMDGTIAKVDNITNQKNYDSEIIFLKEDNNKLNNKFTNLISCLFLYKYGERPVPNLDGNPGGGSPFIKDIERCRPIMGMISNSN